MNPKNEQMHKEKIIKDDGRYLYFYTFEKRQQSDNPKAGKDATKCQK